MIFLNAHIREAKDDVEGVIRERRGREENPPGPQSLMLCPTESKLQKGWGEREESPKRLLGRGKKCKWLKSEDFFFLTGSTLPTNRLVKKPRKRRDEKWPVAAAAAKADLLGRWDYYWSIRGRIGRLKLMLSPLSVFLPPPPSPPPPPQVLMGGRRL